MLVGGLEEAEVDLVDVPVGREQVGAEEEAVGCRRNRPRAALGCRPSSAIRAAMSAYRFGYASSIRETHARSSAQHATWAPMKVVAGWVATRASKESMIRSNDGNVGTVADVPVGIREQLLQPLVRPVERLEEGDRVGDVDRDGDAQACRRVPERTEPTVVGHQQLAAVVTDPQTELLPDLQPARTGEDAAFELRRESVAEPCLLGDAPVQLAEREEPVRMGVSYRSRLARSSSPCRPSRFTTVATLHASITSSNCPTSGADHP